MKHTDKDGDEIEVVTGMKIRTKRGYEGTYLDCSIDGSIAHITLNDCTYSDEHWYDDVPMKDIIFVGNNCSECLFEPDNGHAQTCSKYESSSL